MVRVWKSTAEKKFNALSVLFEIRNRDMKHCICNHLQPLKSALGCVMLVLLTGCCLFTSSHKSLFVGPFRGFLEPPSDNCRQLMDILNVLLYKPT